MSLYFVAIAPDSELSDKIRTISRDFLERFESSKAYKNFPHITVIPPFQYDGDKESEVVGKFLKMNLNASPFHIKLCGFSCFPNKNHPVIFIKPENSAELKEVYRQINPAMPFNYISNFNPHLTVAYRDLSTANFEKAWKEYETKPFDESFLVEKIGLYKHFNGKWNLISEKELHKKS
ncbi:2'-5' RNA ligase family protein [Chryseobacterium sp.]|uniref:2'-5' RNA ligase family protein n=1 Tax=Chryseobacterium sp. TaxID=1871047 RepID=UPI0011C84372|nr:2'-5' RNA ligase family protein [Chryseobacterium sp.]TXF75817.1 2'-5' RNA ligase family protein [Chryseobacterium sp.]